MYYGAFEDNFGIISSSFQGISNDIRNAITMRFVFFKVVREMFYQLVKG